MMKKFLLGLVLLAALLIPAPTFGAVCYPTKVMEKIIGDKFQQKLVITGRIEDGSLFRLYASEEDHEWTVVIVYPNKRACAVFAGTDLDTVMSENESILLSPEVIKLFKKLLGVDV